MTRRDRRNAWHIDQVNKAPDSVQALEKAFEWLKSALENLGGMRAEDAEGFRWQAIFVLAEFTTGMHRHHPEPQFRTGRRPYLPGGGWQPKERPTAGTEARR